MPPEDPYEATAPKPDGRALAERYVIGAMLQSPAVIGDVQAEVTAADFEDMRLGAIFAGVCQMAAEKQPIDFLTVWDQLSAWDVRGIDLGTLSSWVDQVPTARNAGHYARLVREASMRRSLAAIGSRLSTAEDPVRAMRETLDALGELSQRGGSAAEAKSLGDLLNVPDADLAYDWVIPGLLERQDRLMLTGTEGSGKSVLLRQLAILTAAGLHPTEFHQIEPQRVLVIDAENSERQWQRSVAGMTDQAAMRGRRDPRPYVHVRCAPAMDITRPDEQGRIHRLIDAHKPDLLLIGPLYRLVPRAIQSDDDAAPVLSVLDGLRERGVSMLIEAHAGHASAGAQERDLRPRGSSALLGWPEFGLGLRRDKQRDGRMPTFSLVRWRGDRDRREWPSRLVRGSAFPWEPTLG